MWNKGINLGVILMLITVFQQGCSNNLSRTALENPTVRPTQSTENSITPTIDFLATPIPTLSTTIWPPRHRVSCEKQGGIWEQSGFSPARCNLPTSDSGKSCQASNECESFCTQSEEMVSSIISGDEKSGICYGWTYISSCITLIENGEPILMCID